MVASRCSCRNSLLFRWNNVTLRVFAALVLAAGILVGCRPNENSSGSPPEPKSVKNNSEDSADNQASSSSSLLGEDVFRPACEPKFVDVGAEVGVDFEFFSDAVPERFFLPEVMGGGVAWLDYDRDGWQDLYVMNGAELISPDLIGEDSAIPRSESPKIPPVNRLYRNLGDRFVEVAAWAGDAADPGYGQGVAVGDFNADGFPDLYLGNFRENVLLENNGDGTFTDVTAAAGVGDSLWTSSCIWLDLDEDQDLDLYVCNYLDVSYANWKICRFGGAPGYCGPGEYNALPDRAYLNQGDGRFVESADALGLLAPNGKGLAICAVDLDDDLRPEIYVANDMTSNFLFTRTEADSTGKRFREAAAPAGCATSEVGQNEASMGVACADFDGDGAVDLFLTHFFSHKNTLYRNLGGLLFRDDSKRSRIAAASYQTLGFGTIALDYDRDGDNDLFIANGHVLGPNNDPNEMRPQLLVNDGRGRFDDASDYAGEYFQRKFLGRGAAGGDFDNDGDLDLAVSNVGQPLGLLRNETPNPSGATFLGFDLRHPQPHVRHRWSYRGDLA